VGALPSAASASDRRERWGPCRPLLKGTRRRGRAWVTPAGSRHDVRRPRGGAPPPPWSLREGVFDPFSTEAEQGSRGARCRPHPKSLLHHHQQGRGREARSCRAAAPARKGREAGHVVGRRLGVGDRRMMRGRGEAERERVPERKRNEGERRGRVTCGGAT
jgi:hypothetical protein